MKFRTLFLSLSLTAAPMAGCRHPQAPTIDQQFEQTVQALCRQILRGLP